ncbi:hypothetical protein ES708_01506 [subsurface metagenome]
MAFNAKPKILYDSLLERATLSATDTAAGYDVDNITDLRPYTLHVFNAAGTKYITADYGPDVSADCLAIAGHNLGTAGATVSVEYSSDNFSADTNEALAGFQPSDDLALMKGFTSAEAPYWRIKIVTAAVAAQIGVALLGEILTFERWPQSRFDPDALKIVASSETSKAGNMLGATLQYVTRNISLSFANITPTWIANTFKPAWDAHLELLKPFFFAWDITNHATEVYFVRIPEKFSLKMPYNPVRRSLTLTLTGVKE